MSTLFVTIIVTSLSLAMAIGVVAFRRDLPLWAWGVGLMLHTCAYVLYALRGVISDFLSIVVANIALSGMFALFALGVASFQKRRFHPLLVWGPVGLAIMIFNAFINHQAPRLLFGGLLFSFQALVTLVALIQYRRQTFGRGQYILMAGFALIITIFVLRIGLTLLGQAEMLSVSASNQFQYVTFLAAISSLMLLATGLILMVQEQTEHALRESEAHLNVQNLELSAKSAELEAANRRLAELAITDGLTGLVNRRHFDNVLVAEWQRAQRTGQSLALLMIDVDLFKDYNDHYGHQAGDECLVRIAQTLEAGSRRGGDLVARYGGEEFVVIAPDTDLNKALVFARALADAVTALAIPHPLSPHRLVTVSIGVAAAQATDGARPDDLLKRADEALYRAKSLGRHRVES